ncbi:hypothetical protein BDK51DRAFT_26205, partial [Blyttiomyces helicus]
MVISSIINRDVTGSASIINRNVNITSSFISRMSNITSSISNRVTNGSASIINRKVTIVYSIVNRSVNTTSSIVIKEVQRSSHDQQQEFTGPATIVTRRSTEVPRYSLNRQWFSQNRQQENNSAATIVNRTFHGTARIVNKETMRDRSIVIKDRMVTYSIINKDIKITSSIFNRIIIKDVREAAMIINRDPKVAYSISNRDVNNAAQIVTRTSVISLIINNSIVIKDVKINQEDQRGPVGDCSNDLNGTGLIITGDRGHQLGHQQDRTVNCSIVNKGVNITSSIISREVGPRSSQLPSPKGGPLRSWLALTLDFATSLAPDALRLSRQGSSPDGLHARSTNASDGTLQSTGWPASCEPYTSRPPHLRIPCSVALRVAAPSPQAETTCEFRSNDSQRVGVGPDDPSFSLG